MGTCINCGKVMSQNWARCGNCRAYLYRRGVERPKRLWSRVLSGDRKDAPTWCIVCGHPHTIHRGMCNACYSFWKVHRKKRPRYLWDDDVVCMTCKRPLIPLGTNGRRKGYCDPCYRYMKKHNEPRPRRLWGIGPLGWCECGQPAVTEMSGFTLCQRCADDEKGEY